MQLGIPNLLDVTSSVEAQVAKYSSARKYLATGLFSMSKTIELHPAISPQGDGSQSISDVQ